MFLSERGGAPVLILAYRCVWGGGGGQLTVFELSLYPLFVLVSVVLLDLVVVSHHFSELTRQSGIL